MSSTQTYEQNARMALLKYYSSECTAHGTYILTAVIALFAFLHFLPFAGHPNKMVNASIVASILSCFSTALTHFIGRSLFWGYLASNILCVKPRSYEKTTERLKQWIKRAGNTYLASNTYLARLHFACSDYVTNKYRIVGKFSRIRIKILASVFVVSVIFFFVLQLYWLELIQVP